MHVLCLQFLVSSTWKAAVEEESWKSSLNLQVLHLSQVLVYSLASGSGWWCHVLSHYFPLACFVFLHVIENDGHKQKIAASVRHVRQWDSVSNCCQSNLSRPQLEMAWGSNKVLKIEASFYSPETRQGSVSVVCCFLDSCLNLMSVLCLSLVLFPS